MPVLLPVAPQEEETPPLPGPARPPGLCALRTTGNESPISRAEQMSQRSVMLAAASRCARNEGLR